VEGTLRALAVIGVEEDRKLKEGLEEDGDQCAFRVSFVCALIANKEL